MTTKIKGQNFRAPITSLLNAERHGKPWMANGRQRWRSIGITLATSALIATTSAQPQTTYPDRPIRFVVPSAPGGGTDTSARFFGQKLGDALRQQVVIDNRAGAGGIIGADIVAKAPADGYTLMLAASSQTVLPSLHKKLPYDIVKDLAPISLLVSYPLLFLVHPSLPAHR